MTTQGPPEPVDADGPLPSGASAGGFPAVTEPPRKWSELSLDGLRAYRRTLAAEEEKVSYWRRLVHARIDVLEAGAHHERPLTIQELVRVLGDTGAGHGRSALVTVEAADPLPDLPVLDEMWVTELDPHDPMAVADAVSRLHVAEVQLTDYRRALHQRLDDATQHLIERYQEDPGSALVAFSRPHTRTGGTW